MRKVILGLAVLGLLAMAGPAMAQGGFPIAGGTADPQGLISAGALIPFFVSGGNDSYLEISSPVGANPNLHMIFFNQNCVRGGESVGLPLTTNDIAVYRLDASFTGSGTGLAAIAGVDGSGFNLIPLESPIHLRSFFVNVSQDAVRIVEPIALNGVGVHTTTQTWNPLRTAHTFFAPLQSGGFATTLYLICPRSNVQGAGAFDTEVFFSAQNVSLLTSGIFSGDYTDALRARIYDDDELFLRDTRTPCNCVKTTSVSSISTVYGDAVLAPAGTYTEIESNPAAVPSDFAWTGYRQITAGGFDVWNRLSGGARSVIQGNLDNITASER